MLRTIRGQRFLVLDLEEYEDEISRDEAKRLVDYRSNRGNRGDEDAVN